MRKLVIDNPAAFTPLPHGLLDVVQWPGGVSPHWQNGIVYETNCDNAGDTTFDECTAVSGAPAPSAKEPTHEGFGLRGATPFTVRVEFQCSTVGSVERARETAQQALDQSAGWQVENAFWTGTVDEEPGIAFPHLAADTEVVDPEDSGVLLQSVPVTGAGADIACGLGFLEQVMGDCYNGAGVIHVPRIALPTLDAWNLVRLDARGRLVTGNGNLVAVGSGYPGTSPGGVDPAECSVWIYATGAVFGFRGEVKMHNDRESIDRATNTIQMHAEQTYLFGWDCCHAAIQVDLGVPGPSGG